MNERADTPAPAEVPTPTPETATISEELLIELDATLCCVAQLLDGWHNDGTAWSEWDESVRNDVSRVHRKVYDIHQAMLAKRAEPTHEFGSIAIDGSSDRCGIVILPGLKCGRSRAAPVHADHPTIVPTKEKP